MTDLPLSKEMTIHVPQCMQRYFYELIAGAACIIAATIISLTMMYQVLDEAKPEWVRLIYFLVLAFSFAVLIFGFKLVVDSESERKLAAKYYKHEWMMDITALNISIALLEGKERAVLRKFKTGAVNVEWEDLDKMVFRENVNPQRVEIYVLNHEMTLGENAVLHIRKSAIAPQLEHILAFLKERKVNIEVVNSAPVEDPAVV